MNFLDINATHTTYDYYNCDQSDFPLIMLINPNSLLIYLIEYFKFYLY